MPEVLPTPAPIVHMPEVLPTPVPIVQSPDVMPTHAPAHPPTNVRTPELPDSVSPLVTTPVGTDQYASPTVRSEGTIENSTSHTSSVPTSTPDRCVPDNHASRRRDPAFNRGTRNALDAGIPFTTLFDPNGQPVDDAVRLASLIGVFHDQPIPMWADPSKAKLPITRFGVVVHTASSQRYDVYKSASTSKEYFEVHPGSAAEARADFYNDIRKGVFIFTDSAYSKMRFLFTTDSALEHVPVGERAYHSLVTNGMEDTAIALERAMVKGNLDAASHTFVIEDLINRVAAQTEFDNIRKGLDIHGAPLPYHGDSDYAYRLEELTDYIRIYANHAWSTSAGIGADDNMFSKGIEEIALALVSNDSHDVIIDSTRIASLKGYEGTARESMIRAIAKEITDMIDISTFELCELPKFRRAIPTKLVLKVKHRADGTLDKYKARMVVQGFHQIIGKDFHATFSPMASFVNVRLVISLAVTNGWSLMHADVPQAFLRSSMDTDVYVDLAKGIQLMDKVSGLPHNSDGQVLKLRRALYGLKQSPQLWNKEMNSFLVDELGWTRADNESCLYYFHDAKSNSIGIALLEVDDILVTGNNQALIDSFHYRLNMKYGDGAGGASIAWEKLSSFLGINIIYDQQNRHLTMDVTAKITTLFADHKLLRMLPSKATPMSDVSNDKRPPLDAAMSAYIKEHYASLVGAMIYMSISCRPDISYAVGRLSRHMHNTTDDAARDCAHLLGYLNDATNKGLGLLYCVNGNSMRSHMVRMHGQHRNGTLRGIQGALTDVHGRPIDTFTDSNLCGEFNEQRKSTSGFAIFHLFHLISWKSKLQPITAASSHEAELIALAYGADEMMWIRKMLDELWFCYKEMVIAPTSVDTTTSAQRASVISALDDAPSLMGSSERSAINTNLCSTPTVAEQKEELRILENARPSWHDDYKWITRFKPSMVLIDNMGLRFTVTNPDTNQQRSRHLDMRLFKIRDYIKAQCARVVHVDTTDNIADMFTKPLPKVSFRLFRDLLMCVAIPPRNGAFTHRVDYSPMQPIGGSSA
jgi:hypothetical protein